ncbi:CAP domain-containing protein [Saccharospirillum impatiens]|uniref:CAP domain-containing protein n=1 Tax=Saccharospirillum impatiens TaxID=169438 RepID=UPI000685C854|nr:CAP domain-containing protein [Saccharospirillum impatiens]
MIGKQAGWQVGLVVWVAMLAACNTTIDEAPAASNVLAGTPLQARYTSAFSVIDHSPVDGAENQALTRDIRITFDTPLLIESITDSSVELWLGDQAVPAGTVYVADTQSIRLIPASDLMPNQTYRVQLDPRLMSAEGDLYGGAQWQFRTAGPVGATSQWTLDNCMGATEQAWLEQINQARSSARYCGRVLQGAAAALSYQCSLSVTAQRHSDDMARHGILSHLSSDGQDAYDRLQQQGYEARALGENLAMTLATDARVVQQWLASPGHCRNLMDDDFTSAGIGQAVAENGDVYWTLNLATPDNPQLDD